MKRPALSLAPGIVAVFKDKELEQEVLLRRRSRAFSFGTMPRPPKPVRVFSPKPSLTEKLAAVVGALRGQAFSLGRLPSLEEVPEDVLRSLRGWRVGWPRAAAALSGELSGDEAFKEAGRVRREDLLVHVALQQFPGSPKYRNLPRSLQMDIKAFCGNLASAQAEGKRLLFAAGDREGIRTDVETAITCGLGRLRGEGDFRFHSSVLTRLSPRLRVLVGCAEVLQGGVVACDFVDVDIEKTRVSMVSCDDVGSAVPFVTERVKVDLGRLKVRSDRYEPGERPIYFKSRFLPAEISGGEQQFVYEVALMATGLFKEGCPEPKWATVMTALGMMNATQ